MTFLYKDGLKYYSFPTFNTENIIHGFFSRHGGCSPEPYASLNMATSVGDSRENVIENRKLITSVFGLDESSIYDVWQVHSNKVIIANSPRPREMPHIKADAIISNAPGVTLLMLFADCVPIIIYDRIQSVIGIAHAGWRGTLNNVAGETISVMKSIFHCDPKNLIAGIGPSIAWHHYQIGQELSKRVSKKFKNGLGLLKKNNGNIYFNLQEANRINLMREGVEEILISNICTACETDDWFSHRGDGGKTGRFATIISIRD